MASIKMWLGWTPRESGAAGFRCVNGDAGQAQGKYQFDYRFSLVPFMQRCVNYSSSRYSGFQKFIGYGANNSGLVYNSELANTWISFCDKYPTEFEQLQDRHAYEDYYVPSAEYVKSHYGINMEQYSPAVRGTLFSMSIRSGQQKAAGKMANCAGKSDREILDILYSSYGNDDAGRWTISGQWGDAINALNEGAGIVIDTEKNTGSSSSSNTVDYAQRIIDIAMQQQGNPGGQKFWSWWGYGVPVAWCAIFVSWCAEQAGIPTSIIPKAEAVSQFVTFARNNNLLSGPGAVPKKGDLFLKYGRGAEHVGIVTGSDGTSFSSIEGNYSDRCCTVTRSINDPELEGFFSPAYPAVSGSGAGGSGTGGTGTGQDGQGGGKTYDKQILKYLHDIAKDRPDGEIILPPLYVDKTILKQSKFSACQLVIFHGKDKYLPVVEDGVTWELERQGSPGKLDFNIIPDKSIKFEEGDAVTFKWNDSKVFYGFVFEKKRTQANKMSVTCYDQLRYLKNKDTYVYKMKTADEIIKMIAYDFGLNVGTLENTRYKIPTKVEDNKTLFDIISNALNDTLYSSKNIYVLYDDFGKLMLKNTESMQVDILIDAQTGQTYSYTSSINGETYNKVKLAYQNDTTQSMDIYISKDSNNINKWGVLQYFETISSGTSPVGLEQKADTLLKLYNSKTRNLKIDKCFGDVRVRAGSSVVVTLKFDDIEVSNYMLVEKVKHSFEDLTHTMDLTLRGGEFIA